MLYAKREETPGYPCATRSEGGEFDVGAIVSNLPIASICNLNPK